MTHPGSSVDTARSPHQAAARGPFQPHGNPHLFFGGGGRGEIVETMLRAIRDGEPVLHVHGERGSGRTLLSLVLADRLSERHRVLRHDRALTRATLLRTLLLELCPQHADLVPMDSEGEALDADAFDVARRSLVFALEERSVDVRPLVLLVDADAECDRATLELAESLGATRAGRGGADLAKPSGAASRDAAADARGASDGEPAVPERFVPGGSGHARPGARPAPERRRRRPAVQIVLFHRIDAKASRAIVAGRCIDRPENHYWLRRLGLAEVGEYLHHHMLLFDYNRRHLFSREMAYFVADRSEGVFRSIDSIARNAFTIAGLQSAERPTMSHLLLAGLPPRDPEPCGTSFLSRHRGAVVALLGASGVGLLLTALLLATR